jgi:hydroxymethylbilane synthase
MTSLRIATRGSKLALWQAQHIAEGLRPIVAPALVELVIVQTTGDRVQDRSLGVIGGQGVFTKEIQHALLDGRADLAVHSLKDLPTEPVDGLVVAAVPPRASTADALISPRFLRFDALPHGARIATGSSRRRAQILNQRPDLELVDIRGNVDTRLRKLEDGNLDGLILAAAGLDRLGLSSRITEILSDEWMLPAVGQGALGLECRSDDKVTLAAIQQLNHQATFQAVTAERAFLRTLGGGCILPIACLGKVVGSVLTLRGTVCSPDGAARVDGQLAGPATDATPLGMDLARQLLRDGAGRLLT